MITIWEELEDHDNSDLELSDWLEQMEDTVRSYNEANSTTYDPRKTVQQYINRQKDTDR